MESNGQTFDELLKTLNDTFNLLANEVQLLSDRKTILEHKLRFAHEQYQVLADKYAPTDPEISSTLAKLQLPPDVQLQTPESGGYVPLPPRKLDLSKHQTAVAIRDGRLASKKIAALRGWGEMSEGINSSCSRTTTSVNGSRTSYRQTSQSTLLEQDFTIPGKKSRLQCPFSAKALSVQPEQAAVLQVENNCPLSPSDALGTTVQGSTTCALDEMVGGPPSASGSAAKCPIRFMDQQSPEEIARYFEVHKHEIPRSHEICVRRYQRNEQDVRKLDAKYGDLVSMIKGLGQKHQPMLPTTEEGEEYETDNHSNERVHKWAEDVSADEEALMEPQAPDGAPSERESRFDRPLKEIRLGESPSRPWGIPVPYVEDHGMSQPSQPLRSEPDVHDARSLEPSSAAQIPPARPIGKCPFAQMANQSVPPPDHPPVGHIDVVAEDLEPKPRSTQSPQPASPTNEDRPRSTSPQPKHTQRDASGPRPGPRVIFSGPVFIGYPPEQAAAFMREMQAGPRFQGFGESLY